MRSKEEEIQMKLLTQATKQCILELVILVCLEVVNWAA
jgi:hypothetical protein